MLKARLAGIAPVVAVALALAAGSACSGTEQVVAGDEPEIIDPAAAVAASGPTAQDVVAPRPGLDGALDGLDGALDGAEGREASGSDDGSDETDSEEIDPLAVRGEIISEYNLVNGECFNRVEGLQAGRHVAITARVDCAEPHTAEIFHTFEMDAAHPAIYPGDDTMRRFALRACYDHFEAFVGISYELSVYGIEVFAPNRTNFEDEAARYRGVHCWLYDTTDKPMSGTARGTAR